LELKISVAGQAVHMQFRGHPNDNFHIIKHNSLHVRSLRETDFKNQVVITIVELETINSAPKEDVYCFYPQVCVFGHQMSVVTLYLLVSLFWPVAVTQYEVETETSFIKFVIFKSN